MSLLDVKTASEMKKTIDSMGRVTGCQAAHVERNQTEGKPLGKG